MTFRPSRITVTYRIVNGVAIAMMVAFALFGALTALGLPTPCSMANRDPGCILCGCTRDFVSMVNGEYVFRNPLSPFIFIGLATEFTFRTFALFARHVHKAIIVTDAFIHSFVAISILGWAAKYYSL